MSVSALVLAGGGSLGAAQAGALEAIVEAGERFDLIVGASAGAINGAFFAGDPTLAGARRLCTTWAAMRKSHVMPLSAQTLMNMAFRRTHLFAHDALRHLLNQHIPYADFTEARLRLLVIATDLLTGDAVVMATGDAVDAVLASSAMPAAVPPVRRDGRYLVEAAVTSNTPVRIAVACGARRLIVVPTGFVCALPEPPRGAIANALQALTLLIARQLVAELEALGPEIDYAIVPTLCPLNASPYDFSRSAELIEASAASTRAWVDGGGLNTRVIPNSLRPHHH